MLPRPNRLTSGEAFRHTIRQGRKAGCHTLVVHWDRGPDVVAPVKIGFVVSKAVGNAVVRNQVKRRLRHLTRGQLSVLPDSGVLVVRALAGSAGASSAELGADLARCLDRVIDGRAA